MAITILDQPTNFARYGQKLIVMASSTNVVQPNFRYVVRIYNISVSQFLPDFILPPNPANKLVFDLHDAIESSIPIDIIDPDSLLPVCAVNFTAVLANTGANTMANFTITILEGYDVDGVFTIDEGSGVDCENKYFLNAHHKVIDGYKPDPNQYYSFAYDAGILGSTKLLMGDRKPSTHYHDQSINRAPSNQQVFIPVRKSEADYGCLSYITQSSGTDPLNTDLNSKVRMTIFSSTGSPSSFSYDSGIGGTNVAHIQCYPANLNAHGSLLRPADFPNWKYYTIALYDSTNTNRVSAEYVFYPVADDCRFDNVRLGWWSPIKGGWDFFNFSKKSEEVVEVERKRMKKVVGTYASDTFSFNPSDRETAEMVVDSTEYLNITSNWIQEGEFELLKSLVKSHSVYIINDDGTVVPVLVEDNSYTVRRDRTAKLYNQTFKLRYSQQYM